MSYGPDDARRDLIGLWEGTTPEAETAPLEFFLLDVLASGGSAGVRAWAADAPVPPGVTVDTGRQPPELVRISGPGAPPVVVTGSASGDMSWVDVVVERPTPPPPPERPEHTAFYAMWDRLSLGEPPAVHDEPARAVYLVGLFEAEVMNGGLGQYLSNTQGALLGETCDVLERIGATKSRELLDAAAALKDDGESWDDAWDDRSGEYARLDADYLTSPEDLAGLTASTFRLPLPDLQ